VRGWPLPGRRAGPKVTTQGGGKVQAEQNALLTCAAPSALALVLFVSLAAAGCQRTPRRTEAELEAKICNNLAGVGTAS